MQIVLQRLSPTHIYRVQGGEHLTQDSGTAPDPGPERQQYREITGTRNLFR